MKRRLAFSLSYNISIIFTSIFLLIIIIFKDWQSLYYLPILFILLRYIVYFIIEKKLINIVNKANNKNFKFEYFGVFRDIEELINGYKSIIEKERDDLKEFYAKFNSIFNNIVYGVIMIDEKNIIETTNKKMKEYFHFVNIKPGMPFYQLLKRAGLKLPMINGRYEIYSKRMKKNFEVNINKKDDYTIIIFNDITTIKNLRKSLELSRSFTRMGELIGDITHGLKTPVARVKMAFEMYEMFKDEESLLSLKQEIEKLNIFTLETLNLFKSEINNFDAEKIQINNIMNDIKLDFKSHYKDIHFHFEVKTNEFNANKQLFISFIKNIIQNSVDSILEKLTNNDFNPKIKVYIKKYENKIKFIFYDNGMGMDKYTKENFMKPYYTTKEKGNGMGSIFIQKFIINHNGNIKIRSKKDYYNVMIIEFESGD